MFDLGYMLRSSYGYPNQKPWIEEGYLTQRWKEKWQKDKQRSTQGRATWTQQLKPADGIRDSAKDTLNSYGQ